MAGDEQSEGGESERRGEKRDGEVGGRRRVNGEGKGRGGEEERGNAGDAVTGARDSEGEKTGSTRTAR